MANFFDQFDTPAAPSAQNGGGNFFDQFDQQSAPVTATGLAQQGGIGIAKGAIGLAGAPHDVNEASKSIGGLIGDKIGISPETQAKIGSVYDTAAKVGALGPLANLGANVTPGAASIRQAVEKVTGPFREAQNLPEKYAETAGEFLPGLLGNKGNILTGLAKNVLLPAAASETAGQATQGTAAEPYARIAAAIASPIAAEKIAASRAASAAASAAIPTSQELKAAATAAYQSPEVKAVQLAPQAAHNLASTIENDALKQGFRPIEGSAKGTFSIVRELRPSQGTQSVNVDDIDSVRKALGRIAKQRDGIGQPTADATAASGAIRHIDDFLPNIKPADVVAGDATAAAAKLAEARGNYAGYKRSSEVDFRLNKADRQAARSGSGMNIENSLRQKIDQVKDYGLTPAEIAQRDSIVLGTGARNALRTVGKLGVDGGLSLMLHGGSALASGGATLPITIAGTAARKIGETLTRSQIRALNESIRSRSPLGQQQAAAIPVTPAQRLSLLKALLLSNAASVPSRMPVSQPR